MNVDAKPEKPFSNGTTLWFEYLLDSSLLEKQLSKTPLDLNPTDLIIQFLSNAQKKSDQVVVVEDSDIVPDTPRSKKSLALRILALKVVSHLKWDFQALEGKVPLPMQHTLFLDLLFIARENLTDIQSHKTLDITALPGHCIFALFIFHRWVLWAIRSSQTIVKPKPTLMIPMPGGQSATFVPPQMLDLLMRQLDAYSPTSLEVLKKISLALENDLLVPRIPTLSTFANLKEDTVDVEHTWDKGLVISREEFESQLHYDLGCIYMCTNSVTQAKPHFAKAGKFYASLSPPFVFCNIREEYLRGYMAATGLPWEGAEKATDPLEKFFESIKNQFTGFLDLLEDDNINRSLPFHYREMAELDIAGASESGSFSVARDFLRKVQTLNLVRRVVEGFPIQPRIMSRLNAEGMTAWQYFLTVGYLSYLANPFMYISSLSKPALQYLEMVLPKCDTFQRENVRFFLKRVLANNALEQEISKALQNMKVATVLEASDLTKEFEGLEIPVAKKEANFPVSNSPRVAADILIAKLLESFSIPDIQSYLNQLAHLIPNQSFWTLDMKWEMAIPLQSVIMSLPKGNLQDLCYILLAKAKQLLALQEYDLSKEFLNVVANQVKMKSGPMSLNYQSTYKLLKLVEWEILLVDMNKFLEEYPQYKHMRDLSSQCKSCLGAQGTGETIIPRSEIVECCVAVLLASQEWDFLISVDTRWSTALDLASAMAALAIDVVRNKDRPNRKLARNLWDLVVPMFGGGAAKRTASGAPATLQRDSPMSNITKPALLNFCDKLGDMTTLNLMISLLGRLHNVVQDDTTLELGIEYSNLWPAALSNASSYNLASVTEVFQSLVDRALKIYPNHSLFMKLKGDLQFALGFHAPAMRYYLVAALTSSRYFTMPVPKSVIDDCVLRRMIKCCNQLQCYTQAAVLCQFLDETDYATAFKCLQERNCTDAMDALYHFIWDVTILEFLVNLHTKRTEFQRRQQALKVMGLLELNTNNHEEIQKEAAGVRKAKFYRVLTKQYL